MISDVLWWLAGGFLWCAFGALVTVGWARYSAERTKRITRDRLEFLAHLSIDLVEDMQYSLERNLDVAVLNGDNEGAARCILELKALRKAGSRPAPPPQIVVDHREYRRQ